MLGSWAMVSDLRLGFFYSLVSAVTLEVVQPTFKESG
jgi:hypothetical protein